MSFILWGTYTNDLTLSDTTFTPAQLVASLLARLGGVGGVRGYIHESQEAKKDKRAVENAADALAELSAASESVDTTLTGEDTEGA